MVATQCTLIAAPMTGHRVGYGGGEGDVNHPDGEGPVGLSMAKGLKGEEAGCAGCYRFW